LIVKAELTAVKDDIADIKEELGIVHSAVDHIAAWADEPEPRGRLLDMP